MDKNRNNKLYLFVGILVLLSLMVLVGFLRDLKSEQNIWTSKDITGYKIVINGETTNDRKIYWTLNDIITKYILSSENLISEASDQSGIKQVDYYKDLYKTYKKSMSKEKYQNVANNFTNKFVIKNQIEGNVVQTTNIIKKIYKFDGNIYMAELKSDINDTTAFFAVKLDQKNNTYWIMYIE